MYKNIHQNTNNIIKVSLILKANYRKNPSNNLCLPEILAILGIPQFRKLDFFQNMIYVIFELS